MTCKECRHFESFQHYPINGLCTWEIPTMPLSVKQTRRMFVPSDFGEGCPAFEAAVGVEKRESKEAVR